MNYVHDPLRATVKNHNVNAQRDPAIGVRQRRQPALQVFWKWLHPLLQPGRQSSIALQVLLQSWRQVSVALSQSRRQVRIAVLIVAANRVAVSHAEHDTSATITVAVPIVVIRLRLLVVAFAFALAVALRQPR